MELIVNGNSILLEDVTDPQLQLEVVQVEKEITNLRDTMVDFRQLIGTQGERLQNITTQTTTADQHIASVVPVLGSIHDNLRSWGLIGGVAGGGLVAGLAVAHVIGAPIILGAAGLLVGAAGAVGVVALSKS